jgi:hypothetical protein
MNVTTTTFAISHYFAVLIRAFLNNAKIIAGGPHISDERLTTADGKIVKNSIETMFDLDNYPTALVDYVCFRGGQPLVELVKRKDSETREALETIEGLYWIGDDGKVKGKGEGKTPRLRKAAYSVQFRDEVTSDMYGLILGDICLNRCHYCSTKNKPVVSLDAAKKAVDEIVEEQIRRGRTSFWLDIDDSGTIHPKMLQMYKQFFEYLMSKCREKGIVPGINMYMEPYHLTEQGHFDEVSRLIREYNIMGMFVGRDSLTSSNAKIIGRNISAREEKEEEKEKKVVRPRTQEELDAEKEAIKMLINRLQSPEFRFRYYPINISYIFTPFDTKDEIRQKIDEMEEFQNMSTSKVDVKVQVTALAPYPGTQIRAEHIDKILRPEEYQMLCQGSNVWTYFSPASYFLDEALRIPYEEGCLDGSGRYQPRLFARLREALEDVFSGRVVERPYEERRVYTS